MPSITITLSDLTHARLVEFARNEAGTLPEVAAREILDWYLAEDKDRIAETGELIYDRDDGHQYNPDFLKAMLSARRVEQEYGLKPSTVRGWMRDNKSTKLPALLESGAVAKIDNRWFVQRETANHIWQKE